MVVALTVAAVEATSPPLPPPRPDTVEAPSQAPFHQAPPAADQRPDTAGESCTERLARLGVRFEAKPAVVENACSVQDPVLVSELPEGLALSPPSLMACPVAESLTRWAREVVLAEADRHFRSKATKILIGTSYQCRNQRSGGKPSEHAFGNAVDVMGFEFATRAPLPITQQAEGSPEAAFQAAVRTGACPIFTTVLGPGTDADHDDHLHLDLRARNGDYRICQ
jgi:hypothetical protein